MDIVSNASYHSWLTRTGLIVSEKLSVHYECGQGYHLLAAKDIAAKELLIEVPMTACLLQQQNSNSALDELRAAGASGLYLAAAAYLQQEALGESKSVLGPHLKVLDGIRGLGNVLSWKDRERALLAETSQAAMVGTIPVRDRFATVVEPILRKYPEIWPESVLSEDAFVHACELFLSRGFHAEGSENASKSSLRRNGTEAGSGSGAADAQDATDSAAGASSSAAESSVDPGSSASIELLSGPHLVPFADLLNHHPSQYATQLARVGNDFRYYALRDIAKGEQIFATYGQLSDGQLLHTYGFVMPVDTPDAESAEAVAVAREEGETDGLCLELCSNPCNAVLVTSDLVVDTVRKLLTLQGKFEDKAEKKAFDRAVSFLKGRGLLSDAGFTLQVPTNAGAASGGGDNSGAAISSGSPSGGAAAAAPSKAVSMVPAAFGTVLQVLLLDSKDITAYIKACGDGVLLMPLDRACSKASSSAAAGAGTDAAPSDHSDVDEQAMEAWGIMMTILSERLRKYPSTLLDDYCWWAAVNSGKNDGGANSSASSSSGAGAGGGAAQASGDHGDENGAAYHAFVNGHGGGPKPAKKRKKGPASSEESAASASSSGDGGSDPWSLSPAQQVSLGRSDAMYRNCRLVALGEKELIASLMAEISEDLEEAERIVEEREESAEDDSEDGDDDDEDDEAA